ncbi:MAG: outer membrane beta-barrel protein [Crocinitomicaceae bacterium]|nr:outer membrane beta-barrel protein [Crocinitomicaceae bacterium]MBK8925504.1 outer membrane beta-barrel protein [Crocinitomicaceae bacterium]
MSFKDIIKLNSFLPVVLVFTLCLSSGAFSQITNGNTEPEKEKQKKEKKEKAPEEKSEFNEDSLSGTNFYFNGTFQYSYRHFEDQSAANYYREREEETYGLNGGTGLGMLMELSDHFHLDIGIAYYGNSEKYFFQDSLTDSTYAYTSNYKQFALPVRIKYVYGNKFQFFAFAGIAPLNILKIVYSSEYTRENGNFIENEPEEITQGFRTFNAMITCGLGFQYVNKYVGFFVMPEYRRHLFNTYADNIISLRHNLFSLGVNAGMFIRF